MAASFHTADYCVFAGSLLLSIGIGLYFAYTGGRQRTSGEYLMGDRQLSLIPVTISLLVSVISANTLLGVPAEMYAYGINYWLLPIGLVPACFVVAFTFVPLLHPLKVTSCYQYLQMRFKSRVPRQLASALLILKQGMYIGVVLYAPATALEAVTGLPAYASIIAVSFVATVYTTLGGMKAVIWTDVFQCVIMLVGILAILIQGTRRVGSLKKVFEINARDKRIDFTGFFAPDLTVRYTFWSFAIGFFFYWIGEYGINQPTAQRYCALPTLTKAKISIIVNGPGFTIIQTLCALTGVVAYAYYAEKGCDPFYTGQLTNPNQILPLFTMEVLGYPGFPGVMLAAIFSASLSTVSSSLNSMTACLWEDFLSEKYRDLPERRVTMIMKIMVVVFSVICLGMAFLVASIGGTVVQLSTIAMAVAIGPMFGLFVLGGLTTFANAVGSVIGGLFGLAITLWIGFGQLFLGLQHNRLPGRSERCFLVDNSTTVNSTYYSRPVGEYTFNTTTPITPSAHDLKGIDRFYSVSFVWFNVIGLLVTVVIGALVSIITNRCRTYSVKKKLLCPLARRYMGTSGGSTDTSSEEWKAEEIVFLASSKTKSPNGLHDSSE